jgi:ribosome-associated protein
VLLDFGDLVVHVFHEEDRSYYSLERLWKDCPVVPLDLTASASAS